MALPEGIYELHWQRREYQLLTVQLYSRSPDGQMALLNTCEGGPFDTDGNVLSRMLRRMILDLERHPS